MHMGPIADADLDQVRATVDLNLIGTFLCIKHGAPLMARRRRRRASTAVRRPGARSSACRRVPAASPTGTCGPTARPRPASTCCAGTRPRSWAAPAMRVNTVQPGIIDDELMASITAGGPLLDDYLAEMPISRLGHRGGHRRRGPLPGRSGVGLDHRGEPGRRRRATTCAGGPTTGCSSASSAGPPSRPVAWPEPGPTPSQTGDRAASLNGYEPSGPVSERSCTGPPPPGRPSGARSVTGSDAASEVHMSRTP